ncbi:probable phytol kinase, chloroplastic [Coccomyxa sp. Obi]|nr:probable phytol kinase, chloroplastic [Coccomyxa sp. Obi]
MSCPGCTDSSRPLLPTLVWGKHGACRSSTFQFPLKNNLWGWHQPKSDGRLHGTAGCRLRVPAQRAVKERSRANRGVSCSAQLMVSGTQQASTALQVLQQNPLLQDGCATVIAAAGAIALVKIFRALSSRGIVDQKLSRKLVHILAGPGFALCWPLFSAEPNARYFAAIVPFLNLLRVVALGTGIIDDPKTVNAMSREGDRAELLRGPLYYVLVLLGATLVYWRESPVGVAVFSLMCGGDGLADIVGRRLGKTHKLPWNPSKSWAGSGAMFLGGSAMALAFTALFCAMGYFECDMAVMATGIAAIAFIATLIESLPINQKLDDNISVPGVVALLGFLLRKALIAA